MFSFFFFWLETSLRCAGAEHHVIPLEWAARPDPGKVQLAARQKRYEALFRFCREKRILYLMTAHHMDDQLGKRLWNYRSAFSLLFFSNCVFYGDDSRHISHQTVHG